MRSFLHSLLVAGRRLARDRVGTVLGVLSVGLALGAATVATSLIDAYLLRPPPHLTEPERLVLLASRPIQIPGGPPGDFLEPLSYEEYRSYRTDVPALTDLAAYHPIRADVWFGERTEKLPAQLVSASYFSLLGVRPAAGRFFASGGDRTGEGGAVVIADDLWRRELAGDPAAVGSVMRINGVPFTVIGVAPPGFAGLAVGEKVAFWATFADHRELAPDLSADLLADPTADWLFWFVGRLAPGAGERTVQEQLDTLAAEPRGGNGEALPPLEVHENLRLRPGTERQVTRSLGVLIAAVALALVVAAANLAGLLSVGLARRRRELGVRMALGAGRRQLAGLVVAEALLLCCAGGALGLLLGSLANEWMEERAVVSFVPAAGELPVDGRVLAISLALLLAAGLAAAAPPALRALRADPVLLIRAGGGGRGAAQRSRLEEVLVVAELAVAALLLVGAGLLVASLAGLERIDPGFSGREILTVRFDLDPSRHPEASGRDLVRRLLERVGSFPGVRSVSAALQVPFTGSPATARLAPLELPGDGTAPHWIAMDIVAHRYFATLGIPILAGRAIDESDGEAAPRVAVVNARLDRLLGGDSLGRTVRLGERSFEVVGVAADVRHRSLEAEPQPRAYTSLFQSFEGALFLQVAAESDALRLASPIRQAIWQLDPAVPVYGVEHLGRQVDAALAQQRIASRLVGACGALALVLAAVGVFGLTARMVAGRAREVALRLALGAGRAETMRLVMRRTLLLAGAGVTLGTVLASVVGGLLRGSLYGIGAAGPAIHLAAAAVVLAAAALASYLPARRVLQVDPAATLRGD